MKKRNVKSFVLLCLACMVYVMASANLKFENLLSDNPQSSQDKKYFWVCGMCDQVSVEYNLRENASSALTDHVNGHKKREDYHSCASTVMYDSESTDHYQAVCSTCTWSSRSVSSYYDAACMGTDHKNCQSHSSYTVRKI